MGAIKVKELVKKFNGFTAVDSISFEAFYGALCGLLRPNGVGKTTTINIFSTLLKPTSEYAEVAGFDIKNRKDEVRKSIGIVFQDPTLDAKLTWKENLLFYAMRMGIKKGERKIPFFISLTEKNGVKVNLVNLYKPILEDSFLFYTGRKIRNGKRVKKRMDNQVYEAIKC